MFVTAICLINSSSDYFARLMFTDKYPTDEDIDSYVESLFPQEEWGETYIKDTETREIVQC